MSEKEEKEDVKDGNNGDNRGESPAESPGGKQGGGSGGDVSESGSGGSKGRKQDSGGESGGSGSGGESGGGSEAGNAKTTLLDSIRNKRAQRRGTSDATENGTGSRDTETSGGGSQGTSLDLEDKPGTVSRNDRDTGRGNGKTGNSDAHVNDSDRQTRSRRKLEEDKPAGVKIKGADKIKEMALKATQSVEAPKVRFQWDEKPLSNKEADEILPKMKELLKFIYKYMDKGITMTNRNRAEAYIWRDIDEEDIEIIATHLVEMAKASKIIATAIRRVTNSYRLLQIGIINLPKFVQTYQFYAANGGFSLLATK